MSLICTDLISRPPLGQLTCASSNYRLIRWGPLSIIKLLWIKEKHVKRVLRTNKEGKTFLYGEFERLGLDYVPTQANFIFVDFKRDSRKIYDTLLKEGVIIRPGFIWDYPTSARITIGTMAENRRFIEKLERVLRRT